MQLCVTWHIPNIVMKTMIRHDVPSKILPGQIYSHSHFYQDKSNGEWKRKYLLVLAFSPSSDIIYRLLTSRATGREKSPLCCNADPYPGFYLGYIGGELNTSSWLDLRKQDDYDYVVFNNDIKNAYIELITQLDNKLFCMALDCAANADDTTRQQERCMRDIRDGLGCL